MRNYDASVKIFKKISLVVIIICIISTLFSFNLKDDQKDELNLNWFNNYQHEEVNETITVHKSEIIDEENFGCSLTKIDFMSKFAQDAYYKTINNNYFFKCNHAISPNNHIIQIEDVIDKDEKYAFKLKGKRLRDIYDLDIDKVDCSLRKFSKLEGKTESNFYYL